MLNKAAVRNRNGIVRAYSLQNYLNGMITSLTLHACEKTTIIAGQLNDI